MAGAELALVLAPFAKWGAMALLVGVAGWLIMRQRDKGVVARDDVEEIEDALEQQDTARDEVRRNRRRLRDLLGL